MITTIKIKRLNKEFKKLYKISFPKNKGLPLFALSFILKKRQGELIHYYDEDNFIGFTFSIPFKSFKCLVFFATDPKYRNQGYGKRILDIYFENNKNETIFLNCETPENNDEENINYRRFSFYKRNGFLPTPLIMTYKNIDYLSLANKELNNDDLEKLREILTNYGCECRIDTTVLSL